MASLPPLLPTPPASLELRDTDAVDSCAPKRRSPQEPDASGSRFRESKSPPSSRRRAGRSPPPKVRRRSRSPSRVRRRSRSPCPFRVQRRSRSPSPSRARRRSRSPPPSKVRRRSRSPSRVRRQSRSPSTSRVWRRSRSPPSKVRRRSRSPSQVRSRSRSRSPSKVRPRSRSPPPSRVRHGYRSLPPSKVRRRSRSRSPSRVQRRSRSPLRSKFRCRSRSPPPSKARRRSRSPRTSKVRRRSRSPPYISFTQRLGEPLRDKRASGEAAVEGERARSSSLDDSSVENRPSHSHRNCKHPETSSASEDEQKLDSEKMDGKNQSENKAPSRNARRKKMKRQRWAEAKTGMSEASIKNGRRRRVKRETWAEAKKEFREMKKGKLLENIKKLQACILLLEKDGADMAEIMEFRSLLESTKKQYVENEAQLAMEGSSAPLQVLKRDRLENKVEGDEQNMDSGKVEGSDAVSEQNELAEEVNHLKTELETVRRDRDYQLAQTQSLMADVAKQKEVARIYGVELEDAMRRVAALEEGCLLRRETIKVLQIQLAATNVKLTVPPPTRD